MDIIKDQANEILDHVKDLQHLRVIADTLRAENPSSPALRMLEALIKRKVDSIRRRSHPRPD